MSEDRVRWTGVRWTGENIAEVMRFMQDVRPIAAGRCCQDKNIALIIPTAQGAMRAEPGDWIIRGATGGFLVLKAEPGNVGAGESR
jgi:hypothetical protein